MNTARATNISQLSMQGTGDPVEYSSASALVAALKREQSNLLAAALRQRDSEFIPNALLQQNIPGLPVQGSQNDRYMSLFARNGRDFLDVANVANTPPRNSNALASIDPLLLANIIAAERQSKMAIAAEQKARMTDAYRRGREEALLALVRSGALEAFVLQRSANQLNHTPELQHSLGPVSQRPSILSPVLQEAQRPGILPNFSSESLSTGNQSGPGGGGGGERRKPSTSYFDASSLSDPDPATLANRRTRGGVTEPFPEKLHRMLQEVEEGGESDIISFYPHGRAFAVHNPSRFVSEVMPKYYRQSRLSSFQRQLNLCKKTCCN